MKLGGNVCEETFADARYINQAFYQSPEWRSIRDDILIRDNGCDLGVDGFHIYGRPIVHHITPITLDDIVNNDPIIFDADNLITVSHDTHNAIHYGNELYLETLIAKDRSPGDTKLW